MVPNWKFMVAMFGQLATKYLQLTTKVVYVCIFSPWGAMDNFQLMIKLDKFFSSCPWQWQKKRARTDPCWWPHQNIKEETQTSSQVTKNNQHTHTHTYIFLTLTQHETFNLYHFTMSIKKHEFFVSKNKVTKCSASQVLTSIKEMD